MFKLKWFYIYAPESLNKTLLPLRSVLEYNCQVFHFALPAYLSDAIERVQNRVLAIIYPNIDYADSLDLSEILKLSDRRLNACDKLFNNIFTTPNHNLGHLLPERHIPRYNLKQTLFPQEQRPVDLRTPLYRLQLEFKTNPDILIMNYIF